MNINKEVCIQNWPLGRNVWVFLAKRPLLIQKQKFSHSKKWFFKIFFLDLNFLRWFYRYQFAQNPAQNGLILELKLFSFDTDKIIIWYLLYIIIILFYSNMTLNEINYRFRITFSIFAQSKWTVISQNERSWVKMDGP